MKKRIALIHPGEILNKEFLQPLGITQYRLAKSIHVAPRRINEIIMGKRGITADTALRLALFFKNTAEFWLDLQSHYELEKSKEKLFKRLEKEIKAFAA